MSRENDFISAINDCKVKSKLGTYIGILVDHTNNYSVRYSKTRDFGAAVVEKQLTRPSMQAVVSRLYKSVIFI